MGWFEKESYKQGRKDAAEGKTRDVFKVFNDDYNKGYEDGEGLKAGSRRAEYEKSDKGGLLGELIEGVIDGVTGGDAINRIGKSDRFLDSYERGKKTHGKKEWEMPEPRSAERSSSSSESSSSSSRHDDANGYDYDEEYEEDDEYEQGRRGRHGARPSKSKMMSRRRQVVQQEDGIDSPWEFIAIIGLGILAWLVQAAEVVGEALKPILGIYIEVEVSDREFSKMLNGWLYEQRVNLKPIPLIEALQHIDLPQFEAEVKMWRAGKGQYTDEPIAQSIYWHFTLDAADLINIKEGYGYKKFFPHMNLDEYEERFESEVIILGKSKSAKN